MARIILFEDREATQLNPVTLTRPAAFIPIGSYNLHDLATHAIENVPQGEVLVLCRDYLSSIAGRKAQIVPGAELAAVLAATKGSGTLLLNASLRPDTALVPWMGTILAEDKPFMATSGKRIAAAYLPASHGLAPAMPASSDLAGLLLELALPLREEKILSIMEWPFHIVAAQKDLCLSSLRYRIARGGYRAYDPRYPDVWVPDEKHPSMSTSKPVELSPLVAFRTEDGPVILDSGVSVLDFSFFRGPVYLGPGTKVIEHASIKDGVSTGTTCKIGGELECAVIDSFSNKQHHGFLGHAFIGSWVNMGAGTSNSDLKNTYGSIQVTLGNQRIDTAMQFFGCIMGDYSKTAINTSIFTGKIVGVNSMLYGYVGQNVASFTNYASSFGQITECDLEQAIRTQKRMFARRKIEQGPEDIRLLEEVYRQTLAERRISTEPLVL